MERKNSFMHLFALIAVLVVLSLSANSYAQAKRPAFPQAPVVYSPEVRSDRSMSLLKTVKVFGKAKSHLLRQVPTDTHLALMAPRFLIQTIHQ
jgi:hypothetical protein